MFAPAVVPGELIRTSSGLECLLQTVVTLTAIEFIDPGAPGLDCAAFVGAPPTFAWFVSGPVEFVFFVTLIFLCLAVKVRDCGEVGELRLLDLDGDGSSGRICTDGGRSVLFIEKGGVGLLDEDVIPI